MALLATETMCVPLSTLHVGRSYIYSSNNLKTWGVGVRGEGGAGPSLGQGLVRVLSFLPPQITPDVEL